MTQAIVAAGTADIGEAVTRLQEAQQIVDLWLIRYCACLINEKAGLILEAEDERAVCLARPGEGLSAALDELPTFRYLAQLRAA